MRRFLAGKRAGTSADLVVVGLGNPGAEFVHTRHNVGADAAALVAERHQVTFRNEKGTNAKVALMGSVVVAVPTTYMNESGLAVSALLRRFHVEDAARLVVVHDELDLPAGSVRIKAGGGTAGHNGLRSIHAHLHDESYCRVRIGIGKPPTKEQGADHVLRRPSSSERKVLQAAIETAADAVELIADRGVEAAMQKFNV